MNSDELRYNPSHATESPIWKHLGLFLYLEMFQVYALYSKKFNEIYIGYSSSAAKRLQSHNHPKNKGYTKRFQPWELVFTEDFKTRSQAMKREKELKTAKGREYIWQEVKKKLG